MSIAGAYVTHPPLAKWLDRGLRTGTYLTIAATAPFGIQMPSGAWLVTLVEAVTLVMLGVGALGCAWAVATMRPQTEWVLSYPVIGSLCVHLVQHLGCVGVDRYSAVVLAFILFTGARTNYLANLRQQAHRLKDVTG